MAFSPDGQKVATASDDKTARIWDAQSGQELPKLPHEGSVYSVAFSPDGQKVATASDDNTARIWDAQSGQELHKLPHEGPVYSWSFSPDGQKVATASYDRTARIWDAQSGQELHKLAHQDVNSWHSASMVEGPTAAMKGLLASGMRQIGQKFISFLTRTGEFVAFSPDGRKSHGSYDNTARIWDAQSGQELPKLPHEGLVYSVAFSPDGQKVATASDDKTARIWDVQSGQELHKLPHEGSVYSVAFSPDGQKVATASDDKTARIWDVQSGQELHKLPHEGTVYSVAFSPDGQKVATASDDRTAWIWPVSAEDLLKEACKRITANLTAGEWESILRESDCKTCPREGKFDRSGDFFGEIKIGLKKAQRMLWPSSGSGAIPDECQPCIADAFRNRK